MKTAYISDIHSNADALRAVIEDIKKNRVKRLVVLGDIIGYGPKPAETIDILMDCEKKYEIKIVAQVAGNHDKAAAEMIRDHGRDFRLDRMNECARYALCRNLDNILGNPDPGEEWFKDDPEKAISAYRHLSYIQSAGALPNQRVFDGAIVFHEVPKLRSVNALRNCSGYLITPSQRQRTFDSEWVSEYVTSGKREAVAIAKNIEKIRFGIFANIFSIIPERGLQENLPVLVHGHTHIPDVTRTNVETNSGTYELVIVDAGTVGWPRTDMYTENITLYDKASWILQEGTDFNVMLVDYDWKAVKKCCEELGLPENFFWIHAMNNQRFYEGVSNVSV